MQKHDRPIPCTFALLQGVRRSSDIPLHELSILHQGSLAWALHSFSSFLPSAFLLFSPLHTNSWLFAACSVHVLLSLFFPTGCRVASSRCLNCFLFRSSVFSGCLSSACTRFALFTGMMLTRQEPCLFGVYVLANIANYFPIFRFPPNNRARERKEARKIKRQRRRSANSLFPLSSFAFACMLDGAGLF